MRPSSPPSTTHLDRVRRALAAAAIATAGCQERPAPAPEGTAAAPDAAVEASVRRGRAILAATGDSLPHAVGNGLRCTSCHLDDGTRAGAMPWIGVTARYPQYRDREAAMVSIEDRINGCLRRSMNGRALPAGDPAMRDMVRYMASLSRDVAPPGRVPGQGVITLVPRPGDVRRGEQVYVASCARCHGADGEGGAAPPVSGPQSFNVGAGMARVRTAAAFIRHNMPYDRPGTLTDQEAFDVATWLTARPRPDFPDKVHDWPRGGAPADVAYPTRGAGSAP